MIRGLWAEAERKRVAAREREARARHEAEMFTVEAEAYKKALSAFGDVQASAAVVTKEVSASPVPGSKTTITGGEKWLEVYARLTTSSLPPYSYEAIARAASDVGHEVSEGAFRAQMMNAVNAGLFERAGRGLFLATQKGYDLFGPSVRGSTINADTAKANAEEAENFSGALNPNPALDGA
ncbi:MAG: hypothetical protein RLZZ437_3261 [Pseudomonadota bacterium]